MAAVALLAGAATANTAWIFASQGLRGPGGGVFERLVGLLGGTTVATSAALAMGLMGAFLLYGARWRTMLRGPGLAGRARRHALVSRLLLSVAVSAMLVAIPAHAFLYLLAWPAACGEFCGLLALPLLFAAGVVALVSGPAGLVLVRASADLMFWVCVPLGFAAIVEPWLTLGGSRHRVWPAWSS